MSRNCLPRAALCGHKPSDYSNFSIRNIASGGDIWTGSGTGVNTSYVPSAAECDANHEAWDINENIFSNVIHLSYGKFDWFTGGDIQYTGRSTDAWKDIELPISKVMKKVEEALNVAPWLYTCGGTTI